MCPKPLLTQYDYTCLLSKKQDVTRKYFFDPAEKKRRVRWKKSGVYGIMMSI